MIRRAIGLLLAITWAGSVAAGGPPGVPGANIGAIPDGNPSGRSITFNVSGLTLPVADLWLDMDLTHAWVGDLSATLISPAGRARMVVFSRVGGSKAANFGDSSDFLGTYGFSDSTGGNLWSAAAAADAATAVPPGVYRSLSAGSPGRSMLGGCPTSLRGAFSGLEPADANGVWTLLLVDHATPDAGSINAANLYLSQRPDFLFGDGFETGMPRATAAPDGVVTIEPRCYNKPQADLTGDGLADFVLVHNNAGSIEWTVLPNNGNGTAAAALPMFTLGTNSGSFDLIDIDGDRIADPAVWEAGTWLIRPSSRSGVETWSRSFGQTGDDVLQSADYDGDGIDDLAFSRAPSVAPDGPINLHVWSSLYQVGYTASLGVGTTGNTFVVGGFDHNGDGLPDVAAQRDVGGVGDFTLYDGRSGAVFGSFALGTPSDFIIPGNYSGDYVSDVTVSRTSGGNRLWDTRDGSTGVLQPQVTFSITGDSRICGDYDGDGLADHAGWRGSATPGASQFLVRPSTSTASTWTVAAGLNGDYPVANSRVR